MKRFRTHCALITLVGALALCILFSAASAGDFQCTFNSRLTCEYSSWHEGEVIAVTGKEVTVHLVRDLLRHYSKKTIKLRKYGREMEKLSKGDLVLVNCWTKPKRIDWTQFPNSFYPFRPHFMGRIERRVVLHAGYGGESGSRIVTWFYRTGRWDARLKVFQTGKGKHPAVYAALPNGSKYLVYDEGNRQKMPDYSVH